MKMKNRALREVKDALGVLKDARDRQSIEGKIGFFAFMKGIILSLLIVPQMGIYGDLKDIDPQFMQVMVGLNISIVIFNWIVKDKSIEEVFALQLITFILIIPLSLSFIWWKNPYALVILEEVAFIWFWVVNKHLRDSMDNFIADKVNFRNLRMRTQNLNIMGAFVGFPMTFYTNVHIDPFTMIAISSSLFIGLLLWERKNILKVYLG